MNTTKLTDRQISLNETGNTLIARVKEIDETVQKLLNEKQQLQNNLNAVSGALQLIEELLRDEANPVCPPPTNS